LGDDYNGREALRAVNLIKLEGVAETVVEGAIGAAGTGLVVVGGGTGTGLVAVTVATALAAATAVAAGFVLFGTAIAVVIVAESYGASRREKFHELQHSVQRFLETES